MIKLGINVDHVGTLRNSRGESHPDPYLAAKVATKYGANSITIHLREDRRHINDLDVRRICKNKKLTVNLEMAANFKMLKIALLNKPSYVCLVPERRKEITTEGGLNISKNKFKLKKIIQRLNKAKIRTSLFIDPTKRSEIINCNINTDYDHRIAMAFAVMGTNLGTNLKINNSEYIKTSFPSFVESLNSIGGNLTE